MNMTTLLLLAGLVAASNSAFAAEAAQSDPQEATGPRIEITQPQVTRPSALPAMYVSLAGLQAFDGYATIRGVRAGATEMNPLVGGLASQPAAFWTVKAVSTATTIYFAEQLWRQNRRGQAIMTMIVANAVMGVVAARNTSVLKSR